MPEVFRLPPLAQALMGVVILLMICTPVVTKFLYLHTLADRYVVCRPMNGDAPYATVTAAGFKETLMAFLPADVTSPGRFEFTDWSGEKRVCNGVLYFVEENYCGVK